MIHNRYGGAIRRANSFNRYPGQNSQHQQRRGGQRRTAQRGQDIHYSKFINKGADEDVRPYEPKHSFSDFAIDSRIQANISKKGYTVPTAIQDQAIPAILMGRDIVGIANTGTGKTGAFLIPLLDKVVKGNGERVLIVTPTRELAVQIEEEYKGFSFGLGLASVSLIGGVAINPQMRSLRNNPAFVIGTPGRIKDLIERRTLDLSRFKTIVLDEADRMLDMGFVADMRYVMSLMPKHRHTLLFSATLSLEVERLIHELLTNPVQISVRTGDTSKNVDQDIVRVEGKNKMDVLYELLSQPAFDKVLVFGRTKHGVERLSKALTKLGIPAASIHGDKTQANRQRSLGEFKQNKVRVLVATDVAARGLDIPKVSHVINYDVPSTYDDYIHRIGRTGRAGERGKALTFIE